MKKLVKQNQDARFTAFFSHEGETGVNVPKTGWSLPGQYAHGDSGFRRFTFSHWGKVFSELAEKPENFRLSGSCVLTCVCSGSPKEYRVDYDELKEVKKRFPRQIKGAKKLLKKLYDLSRLHKHLMNEELEDAKKLYLDLLKEKQGR